MCLLVEGQCVSGGSLSGHRTAWACGSLYRPGLCGETPDVCTKFSGPPFSGRIPSIPSSTGCGALSGASGQGPGALHRASRQRPEEQRAATATGFISQLLRPMAPPRALWDDFWRQIQFYGPNQQRKGMVGSLLSLVTQIFRLKLKRIRGHRIALLPKDTS